jgi:hypothetical protein
VGCNRFGFAIFATPWALVSSHLPLTGCNSGCVRTADIPHRVWPPGPSDRARLRECHERLRAGQVGHPTAAVARDRGSLRYGHGTPHNRPREFLCRDRLRKQKALDQIEAHLAHCEKIRPRLNPLSDTTCAIAIGESEDSSAHRPFQSIVRTTGYELSIYFDLRKGKVIETDERWPFCTQIVDCDCDIMEAQLPGSTRRRLRCSRDRWFGTYRWQTCRERQTGRSDWRQGSAARIQ